MLTDRTLACGCPCHQRGATLEPHDLADDGHCCQRRHCRRGADCAGRYRDGHDELVGAVLELSGLCDRDRALLERALPELPHLWLALRAMLVPGSAGDGPGRGTRTPPLPLRIDPLITADLIADELQRWEQVVRDRMGMDPPPVGGGTAAAAGHVRRGAQLLSRAVPTLLALGPTLHVRWAPAGTHTDLEEVDGYDAASRLLAMHRTAQRVAGHAVLAHHLPAPCLRCETRTLRRLDGDDYVRCTTCGTTSTEDQYHWLTRVLADRFGDEAPAPTRAVADPPTVPRIADSWPIALTRCAEPSH